MYCLCIVTPKYVFREIYSSTSDWETDQQLNTYIVQLSLNIVSRYSTPIYPFADHFSARNNSLHTYIHIIIPILNTIIKIGGPGKGQRTSPIIFLEFLMQDFLSANPQMDVHM
jgi:hypothetical protein